MIDKEQKEITKIYNELKSLMRMPSYSYNDTHNKRIQALYAIYKQKLEEYAIKNQKYKVAIETLDKGKILFKVLDEKGNYIFTTNDYASFTEKVNELGLKHIIELAALDQKIK